jgi:anthranilate synthase component 2
MSQLAVIDNYDSFTYNLVQYLQELDVDVTVYRNDQIEVDDIIKSKPDAILLSPGPGTPDTAGITLQAISQLAGVLPIFGVCLGHQSIGQHFGGTITHAQEIMHGKLSPVHHKGDGVFAGLPSPFTATRYHSLVIAPESVPDDLAITAWTVDESGNMQEVMGVRHKSLMVEGVQFHPESISSEHGHDLLNNFLRSAGLKS